MTLITVPGSSIGESLYYEYFIIISSQDVPNLRIGYTVKLIAIFLSLLKATTLIVPIAY